MPEQLPGKADAKVKPENPICDLISGIFFGKNRGAVIQGLTLTPRFFRDDKGSAFMLFAPAIPFFVEN
ncbi:MAG: hypothetical protein EBR22_04740 [Cytophagia bacterium]|nr:hypothetical protein [Cytophagia bacterium]